MRLLGCLFAAVCVSFLQSPCAHAQAPDEHNSDVKSEPAHQHRDKHHGHDHTYPDRGAIFRELPRGAVAIHHAGLSYKFSDGIWFESHGQAFIVVTPAIGALVTELPAFVTQVDNGSETYLYANDIFYRARPDLGGYEVVNDPDEVIPPAAAAAAAATPPAATASVNSAVPATTTAATLSTVAAGTAIATPAVAAALSAPSAVPAAAVVEAPVAAAAPVAASSTLSSGTPRGTKVVALPKNGQSPDLQARDHYECYKFAVANSGFDPMHVSGASVAAQAAGKQSDYERAQAACFEGRGYSIQ